MELLTNMITNGLGRTTGLCEKVEKKLLEFGKVIDYYMDRDTPRKKYIYKIILAIPMVMILHQWCLVAPYSTYRIINIFIFLAWVFVSLVLVGTIPLNIRARLRLYLWISVDITMAWITLINYWTYQQVANDMCQEVNVILWTDITNGYTLPFLMTILVRCGYLWVRMADFRLREKTFSPTHVSITLMFTLLPEILGLFNMFPSFMSEFSYWLQITIFIGAVLLESLRIIDIDIDIKRNKIDELMTMARNEENVEKRNRYIAEANYLNQFLKQWHKGNGEYIWRNYMPGQWFVRDCLAASAVCYFGAALIAELVLSEKVLYGLMSIEFVVFVMGTWCTSIATLALFSALLTCLTNICISGGFFFLTTEVHIAEVMNSNTGEVMHMTTLLLFSDTNLLSLAYLEKANAMTIVVLFSFIVIIFQTLDVIERKVRGVVNSGTVHDTSFYIRFGILVGLFMMIPTLTTYQVSLQLHTDFLSLLFASSNFNLIVVSIFLIVECSLVSLKWHTIQYRNRLETIIQYCHYIKSFSVIIACMLQAYFKFYCPFFQAWWLYRLFIASFGAVVSIGFVSNVQWTQYKTHQARNAMMNNLVDVDYGTVDNTEESHDCTICYSDLLIGKVLPCGHSFHKDCLQHLFQVRQVCPICNTNV